MSVRRNAKEAARTKDKTRRKTDFADATTLGSREDRALGFYAKADEGWDPRSLQKAKWTEGSPLDTEMQIRKQYMAAGAGGAGGNTPFGQMGVDGQTLVKYAKEKKDQGAYIKSLRLAEQLIDPLNPATQDLAYSIYDELLKKPQQQHLEELAILEGLRQLLILGRISGRKDNELVLRILQPDFVLPFTPLWDADGQIVDTLATQAGRTKSLESGLFSPRHWGWSILAGPAVVPGEPHNPMQLDAKVIIVRRLYPGMRKKTVEVVKAFIKAMAEDLTSTAANGATPQRFTSQTISRPAGILAADKYM